MTSQTEKLRIFLRLLANEWDYECDNTTITVQAMSLDNAGYTSAPFVASVTAPFKEDLHLFAKVASFSQHSQSINDAISIGFENEHFFYAKVAVSFENLYNKHAIHVTDRLYIPKLYGFKEKEVLVLENLEAKGYNTFDRKKTFTWDYASRAVEEMAKFHAIGIAYKEENRENLEQIFRKTQRNWVADEKVKKIFLSQAIQMGTQTIMEEYRAKMQIFFGEHNLLDDMEQLHASFNGGFLIHGEYVHANLMHQIHNEKIDIVPIDYQTYRLGMLAFDLMYFIWSGSDEVFRRDHYHQLIELYYQKLTLALQKLSINIKNVYPRVKFEKELESVKFLGLFIGLTMISLRTIDNEHKPKLNDFDDLMVKPTKPGLERINGIVGDYIRWGNI